mmetsp:Transcript_2342/g.4495  ORF Transcript_2342/g.4495 Transcript_2342/m.4495 type:complete len:94 (-) Transcript_2342:137-418(-)
MERCPRIVSYFVADMPHAILQDNAQEGKYAPHATILGDLAAASFAVHTVVEDFVTSREIEKSGGPAGQKERKQATELSAEDSMFPCRSRLHTI